VRISNPIQSREDYLKEEIKEGEKFIIIRIRIWTLYQILLGDHVKEDEMGTCSTGMGCEKPIQNVTR
jgi:hypothetical protein